MINKYYTTPLSFLFLIISVISMAQTANTHALRGIVCDDKGPIPYATILVWQNNDTVNAQYGISNKQGAFSIHALNHGRYNGMVRFTGYERYTFCVDLDKDIDLDTLRLNTVSQMLSEVQITASKVFEDRLDKLNMDVSQLQLPQGATYIDALQEIPGAYFDISENSLTVLNKSVMILLNGRPTQLSFNQLTNMLQGEKAEDIGKVEIMYETPARFAGDWSGPVVNIITKKNLATGFYGTVSGNVQMRKLLGESLFANLNFRTLKTNTYLMFSQDYAPRKYTYRTWQYQQTGDTLMQYFSNHANTVNKYFVQTGTGFQINANNSLDINLSGNINSRKDNIIGEIIEQQNAVHSFDSLIDKSQSYWADIYYKHNFSNPQHYVTIDANATRAINQSDNLRRYAYPFDSVVFNRDASPYSGWLFQTRADYYHDWNNNNLSGGIIFRRSDLQNDFYYDDLVDNQWIPNSSLTNDFHYTENNYVAYASFGQQVSERFSYSVTLNNTYIQTCGVSQVTHATTNRNYNVLRPFLTLRYKPHDDHFFTLSFNRGFSKPNYTYLNPFRKYESPACFIEGNPNLSLSNTYNLQLTYRFRYWLNMSLSYINSTKTILLVPQLNDEHAIIGYTYGNFGKSDDFTFDINASKRFFEKKLNLSLNAQAEYMFYNSGDALNYNKSLWHYYGQFRFTYLLVKQCNLNIGGYVLYFSSQLEDYAVSQGMPKAGLNLSASFLEGKLSTTLSINDLFNNDVGNKESLLNGVVSKTDNIMDARYIRFTIRYSFNRKHLREFNRHQGNNSDNDRL